MRKLEAEKLITIGPNPLNQNKHVYNIHPEPMLEWESTATVITRKKKEKLAFRRVKERAAYATKRAMQSQTALAVEARSDSGVPRKEPAC